jgi:hypothetical protein
MTSKAVERVKELYSFGYTHHMILFKAHERIWQEYGMQEVVLGSGSAGKRPIWRSSVQVAFSQIMKSGPSDSLTDDKARKLAYDEQQTLESSS